MKTLENEIRSWWCDSQPDATKDQVIPVLLAMLERIEALEVLTAALAEPSEPDSLRVLRSVKQEAETGLVIGDEIGMRDALTQILKEIDAELGVTI